MTDNLDRLRMEAMIDSLRQQVKELETEAANTNHTMNEYRRELAALKAGQGEPVALPEFDAGLLNDFGGGNVEWWWDYIRYLLSNAHEHYQEAVDTSATTIPQTCFSAGDMADAAAKAFQEGAESNRAATDELLAALKSMFNEYGEFDYTISMLNNARAAIAKHEPKP